MGIVIIYTFLGGSDKTGTTPIVEANSLLWLVGMVLFVISTVIRWGVLPKMNTAVQALPLFLVGLALAEATCLLGLFLFPAHRQELFGLSFVGILQFVPYFAGRYFTGELPAADGRG